LARISAVAAEVGTMASGRTVIACTGGGGACTAAGAVPVQPIATAVDTRASDVEIQRISRKIWD
jgi:hypothetical protein